MINYMTSKVPTLGTPMSTAAKELLRAYAGLLILAEPVQMELWRRSGLTLTQLRILRCLSEGPRGIGSLMVAVGLSGPSLSRVLDRLEERSCLERQVDEDDRRRVEVRILPAGSELLGTQSVWPGTPLEQAVAAMTPSEQQFFREAFGQFAERVNSMMRLGCEAPEAGGQAGHLAADRAIGQP